MNECPVHSIKAFYRNIDRGRPVFRVCTCSPESLLRLHREDVERRERVARQLWASGLTEGDELLLRNKLVKDTEMLKKVDRVIRDGYVVIDGHVPLDFPVIRVYHGKRFYHFNTDGVGIDSCMEIIPVTQEWMDQHERHELLVEATNINFDKLSLKQLRKIVQFYRDVKKAGA